MNTYLKVALTVLVIVGLGFFIRATDWAGVIASVQKVGFKFLILLFSTFVSSWLGVMAWRYCLPKTAGSVSGLKLFWIRLIGENFAIINPTSVIGGEAMKIYMLRNLGIDQRQALHSILLSRAIMIISQIFMMLIAGIWFLSITVHDYTWLKDQWLWWCLIPITMISVLYILRIRFIKNALKSLFHRLGVLNQLENARAYIAELQLELRSFYRENRGAMFLSFLASALHWVVGSLEFYFILHFLGIETTVVKALLVDMGVVVFKSAGAFVPGQIGIEEYGNKVMLAIIGVAGNTIWVTASILRRARQLFWMILALVVFFIFFNKRNTIIEA